MSGSSTSSVIAGVTANILVTIAKFVGFAVTGSGALLSEGIHSVADTSNQALLLMGLKKSERPADAAHPFGYGRDRFFWGLVSALGIFFVGAGVTMYHGIAGLLEPHLVEYGAVTWTVLGLSIVIEGWALWMAARGVSRDAKATGTTFWAFVRGGKDPTILAVLLEDAAAVLGVILVSICIMLTELTGNPFFDALASVLIGVLLAFVAIFLVAKNRVFLITKSVDQEVADKVKAVIMGHESVEAISAFKGTVASLGNYRIAADIDFDGRKIADKLLETHDLGALRESISDDGRLKEYLRNFAEAVLEQLGEEVDDIEDKIRERVPGAIHLDLEQD